MYFLTDEELNSLVALKANYPCETIEGLAERAGIELAKRAKISDRAAITKPPRYLSIKVGTSASTASRWHNYVKFNRQPTPGEQTKPATRYNWTRVYKNVTPASFARAQRAQVELLGTREAK